MASATKKKPETVPQQIRRARLALAHVERLGPSLRWWLRERLNAEECSESTLTRMRLAGLR